MLGLICTSNENNASQTDHVQVYAFEALYSQNLDHQWDKKYTQLHFAAELDNIEIGQFFVTRDTINKKDEIYNCF